MPVPIMLGLVAALVAAALVGGRVADAPTEARRRSLVGAVLGSAVAPLLLSGAAAFVWAATIGGLIGYGLSRRVVDGEATR